MQTVDAGELPLVRLADCTIHIGTHSNRQTYHDIGLRQDKRGSPQSVRTDRISRDSYSRFSLPACISLVGHVRARVQRDTIFLKEGSHEVGRWEFLLLHI